MIVTKKDIMETMKGTNGLLNGIKDKKTYNPLEKLPYSSGELLCCFLAGLIDGDGHISSNQSFKRITIKVHKNWLRFFNSLSLAIAKYFGENKFQTKFFKQ